MICRPAPLGRGMLALTRRPAAGILKGTGKNTHEVRSAIQETEAEEGEERQAC